MTPPWLDSLDGSYATLSAGPAAAQVQAFVPPGLGRCSGLEDLSTCPFRPYRARWAIVSARFDDPVAQTCRITEHPPGPGFTRKAAIAECRADLIVLSVAPAAPETDAAPIARGILDGRPNASVWIAMMILISMLLIASRSISARRFTTHQEP